MHKLTHNRWIVINTIEKYCMQKYDILNGIELMSIMGNVLASIITSKGNPEIDIRTAVAAWSSAIN